MKELSCGAFLVLLRGLARAGVGRLGGCTNANEFAVFVQFGEVLWRVAWPFDKKVVTLKRITALSRKIGRCGL